MDDPTQVDQFMNWASMQAGISQLRGGDHGANQSAGENNIKIEDLQYAVKELEPAPVHAASNTDELLAPPVPEKTDSIIATKTVQTMVDSSSSHRYVPLHDHEISRATYGLPSVLGRLPAVVSVAHRVVPRADVQSAARISSINKLDVEPQTPSRTATQDDILARLMDLKQNAPTKESPKTSIGEKDLPSDHPCLKSALHRPLQSPFKIQSTNDPKTRATASGQDFDRQDYYNLLVENHKQIAEERFKAYEASILTDKESLPRKGAPVASKFKYAIDVAASPPGDTRSDCMSSSRSNVDSIQNAVAGMGTVHDKVLVCSPSSMSGTEFTKGSIIEIQDTNTVEDQLIPHNARLRNVGEKGANSESGMDVAQVMRVIGARIAGPDDEKIHLSEQLPPLNLEQVSHSSSQSGSGTKTSFEAPISTTHVDGPHMPSTSWTTDHNNVHGQARTAIIKTLPDDFDYSLLASFVHGGLIDNMTIDESAHLAYVTFVNPNDCNRYVNKHTTDGLALKRQGRSHAMQVELSSQLTVIGEVLQAYLKCGATRVLEIDDIDDGRTVKELSELAEECTGRRIECVNDTYRLKRRTTTIRFASIKDAVTFRSTFSGDQQWQDYTIHFAKDPCIMG